MLKKDNCYFQDFMTMAECACQAAEYLQATVGEFSPGTLARRCQAMSEIRHEADKTRRGIRERLMKEFVPPIDRGDIVSLADKLSAVTEQLEDVLIHIFMFNIRKMKPDALRLADTVVRCCQPLCEAVDEFYDFQKSRLLMPKLREVNERKREGQDIFIEAVRRLYRENKDFSEISAWNQLFHLFQACFDACEQAADELEAAVLKNL